MNNLPSFLTCLRADGRIPRSQLAVSSLNLLKPLIAGGILETEMIGRGEIVVVKKQGPFEEWLRKHFPSLDGLVVSPAGAHRAGAVALRRDSKVTRLGVAHSVLHLRAFSQKTTTVLVDNTEISAAELTARHGIAACLLGPNSAINVSEGPVILIENLECFLRAEVIVPDACLALNAAGRISDRLVSCLARSQLGNQPLLHLPDYDPVGLSDYLRLREALGNRVTLYTPVRLKESFERFGNRGLINKKPRNRALLEQLNGTSWPCKTSAAVFDLIKETGAGLEQEALLLEIV